jgi:hypothetical protein
MPGFGLDHREVTFFLLSLITQSVLFQQDMGTRTNGPTHAAPM